MEHTPAAGGPRLSVILPSYGGGRLAGEAVARLRRDFVDFGDSLEIIIVDDGGHDISEKDLAPFGAARLITFPENRGKGAAVRAGMLAAKGRARVYTDIDIPFGSEPIRAAEYFISQRGFHVVVGDRTLPGATYATAMPFSRRISSAIFSFFVGRVVTGGYYDTQCGLKGFRSDVADHLFQVASVNRFAFDVELMYVSLKNKLDIKRIVVRLERNETSSVRIVSDASRMLMDLMRIRLNQAAGRYDRALLLPLVTDEANEERRQIVNR